MGRLITKTMVMSILVAIVSTVAEAKTRTLSPEADTYLNGYAPTSGHGDAAGLIVDAVREALIRFDVSGMSGISSARIRLYCTQHEDTDVKPVILRVMTDTTWNELSATRNNMTHEVPYASVQSPWIGPGDSQYAGVISNSEVRYGEWCTADITSAVRDAAHKDGKLSLHVYVPCRNQSMPLVFASKDNSDPDVRPVLEVTYLADEDLYETSVVEVSDDVTIAYNGIQDNAVLLANNGVREFIMKYAVPVSLDRLETATLRLVGAGEPNGAATAYDVLLVNAGDWDESAVAASQNMPQNVLFTHSWNDSVPQNTVRAGAFATAGVNEVDITDLVKTGVGFSSGYLTLQVYTKDNYVIPWSKNCSDAENRPKIILKYRKSDVDILVSVRRDQRDGVLVSWTPLSGASAYCVERAENPDGPYDRVLADVTATSAYDVSYPGCGDWWYRVVAKTADGERASAAVVFREAVRRSATRVALQNGGAGNSSDANKGYPLPSKAAYRAGCAGAGNTFGWFILFDPADLERAPFVRLRIKADESNSEGAPTANTCETRLFGYLTDRWAPEQFCWNKPIPGIELVSPIPDASQTNELGRIQYNVPDASVRPYMDFDVTEMVRAAVKAGKFVTFQVTGSETASAPFRFFSGLNSSTPPQLYYPVPEGFGNGLTITPDFTTYGKPAAVLSWNAGPTGTTYTVVRTNPVTGRTKTLASDVTATTVVDKRTSSAPLVYAVVAHLPNGQVAEIVETNTLAASVSQMAIADTYIRDASPSERNGGAVSIILKDGKSGENVTREGLARFDLSQVPFDDYHAELSVEFTGTGASFSGNERMCFRTVADSSWSDVSALRWTDVLGSQTGGTAPDAVGVFATVDINPANDRIVTVDVTDVVRQALAAGQNAMTVHFYIDDPDHAANCSVYSRENVMNCFAPRLTFRKQAWQEDGFVLEIR